MCLPCLGVGGGADSSGLIPTGAGVFTLPWGGGGADSSGLIPTGAGVFTLPWGGVAGRQ